MDKKILMDIANINNKELQLEIAQLNLKGGTKLKSKVKAKAKKTAKPKKAK